MNWAKKFGNEFKQFATRGNVLDLAVGVIIGAAFSKIITAAVEDLLMPFLGLFLGAIDLSNLSFTIGNTKFAYGHFLQTSLDFILIAFGVFILVKAVNMVVKRQEEKKATTPDINKLQLEALLQQANLLKKINENLTKD